MFVARNGTRAKSKPGGKRKPSTICRLPVDQRGRAADVAGQRSRATSAVSARPRAAGEGRSARDRAPRRGCRRSRARSLDAARARARAAGPSVRAPRGSRRGPARRARRGPSASRSGVAARCQAQRHVLQEADARRARARCRRRNSSERAWVAKLFMIRNGTGPSRRACAQLDLEEGRARRRPRRCPSRRRRSGSPCRRSAPRRRPCRSRSPPGRAAASSSRSAPASSSSASTSPGPAGSICPRADVRRRARSGPRRCRARAPSRAFSIRFSGRRAPRPELARDVLLDLLPLERHGRPGISPSLRRATTPRTCPRVAAPAAPASPRFMPAATLVIAGGIALFFVVALAYSLAGAERARARRRGPGLRGRAACARGWSARG